MASHIERRKFLATLGGAVVGWPLAARAQQAAMPVIGFLTQAGDEAQLRGFQQGLKQAGFVEGENASRCCVGGITQGFRSRHSGRMGRGEACLALGP